MYTSTVVKNKQISNKFSLLETKRIHNFESNSFEPPIELESRRYIGCKQKLVDWIFEIIGSETKDVKTAADIFAGTGVVAKRMLGSYESIEKKVKLCYKVNYNNN